MAYDRYSYVLNNPVRFTDSSGHCVDGLGQRGCGIRTATRIVVPNISYRVHRQNVPSTLVAAGIAVQSNTYHEIKDSRGPFADPTSSGIGLAQISDAQMNGPAYAYDSFAGTGVYTGDLGLPGYDQTTEQGAVWGMTARIALGLQACGRCTAMEKVVVAALVQNGSGFTAQSVLDSLRGDGTFNFERAIKNFSKKKGGWVGLAEEYYGGFYDNKDYLQFDTQVMLLLYLNNLRELHALGWELPWDLSLEDLDAIEENYIINIDPPGSSPLPREPQ